MRSHGSRPSPASRSSSSSLPKIRIPTTQLGEQRHPLGGHSGALAQTSLYLLGEPWLAAVCGHSAVGTRHTEACCSTRTPFEDIAADCHSGCCCRGSRRHGNSVTDADNQNVLAHDHFALALTEAQRMVALKRKDLAVARRADRWSSRRRSFSRVDLLRTAARSQQKNERDRHDKAHLRIVRFLYVVTRGSFRNTRAREGDSERRRRSRRRSARQRRTTTDAGGD